MDDAARNARVKSWAIETGFRVPTNGRGHFCFGRFFL